MTSLPDLNTLPRVDAFVRGIEQLSVWLTPKEYKEMMTIEDLHERFDWILKRCLPHVIKDLKVRSPGAVGSRLARLSASEAAYCQVVTEFAKPKYGGKVYQHKMGSEVAVNKFANDSLAFVYIDGNHEFDYVMTDLIWWAMKVRRREGLCRWVRDYLRGGWSTGGKSR